MGSLPPARAGTREFPVNAGVFTSSLWGLHPLSGARAMRLRFRKSVRNGQMKAETTADAYPLSPMQEGMLFHTVSAREPGVDIEQLLCTLREPVDAAALERAWQRAVERHDILRTSFHWDGLAAPAHRV